MAVATHSRGEGGLPHAHKNELESISQLDPSSLLGPVSTTNHHVAAPGREPYFHPLQTLAIATWLRTGDALRHSCLTHTNLGRTKSVLVQGWGEGPNPEEGSRLGTRPTISIYTLWARLCSRRLNAVFIHIRVGLACSQAVPGGRVAVHFLSHCSHPLLHC